MAGVDGVTDRVRACSDNGVLARRWGLGWERYSSTHRRGARAGNVGEVGLAAAIVRGKRK